MEKGNGEGLGLGRMGVGEREKLLMRRGGWLLSEKRKAEIDG